MIFISKMIQDPRRTNKVLGSGREWFMPNLMGLTIGLTFHTPKFWDCHKYDFYCNQFDHVRSRYKSGTGLTEEMMEQRYLSKYAHSRCGRWRRHMSYPGYLYWTGPKRRYTFRYMGSTHPRYVWWKPFSIGKHGTYTRLFDNGPQNPPDPERTFDPRTDGIMARHRDEFNSALQAARDEMEEYERVRGKIHAKAPMR